MNLEIQKNTSYTFHFPNDVFDTNEWYKNSGVLISSAKIEITNTMNGSILAETDMTVDTDMIDAYYTWDSTGQDVAENYQVKFKINGKYYNRFFDIYFYPFINTCTDTDLFMKDSALKANSYRVSGKADTGSLTYLSDLNRLEDDGYFEGGLIEIYFDSEIETRKIKTYSKATGTFTFEPLVNSVAAGTGYSARESYQDLIDEAGRETQAMFRSIDRRAYLLIDHSQMKQPIVYRALANYWRNKIKSESDEFYLKYMYYDKEFMRIFEGTIWRYDIDKDGALGDREIDEISRIRWSR